MRCRKRRLIGPEKKKISTLLQENAVPYFTELDYLLPLGTSTISSRVPDLDGTIFRAKIGPYAIKGIDEFKRGPGKPSPHNFQYPSVLLKERAVQLWGLVETFQRSTTSIMPKCHEIIVLYRARPFAEKPYVHLWVPVRVRRQTQPVALCVCVLIVVVMVVLGRCCLFSRFFCLFSSFDFLFSCVKRHDPKYYCITPPSMQHTWIPPPQPRHLRSSLARRSSVSRF